MKWHKILIVTLLYKTNMIGDKMTKIAIENSFI